MTVRLIALALIVVAPLAGARPVWHNPISTVEAPPKSSRDLIDFDTTYTFPADFEDTRLGHGSSIYTFLSYDRRFRTNGHWYARLGAEYMRLDFGGSDNGLPGHLQAIFAHLAFEYVIYDRAVAGIRLHPGFYFQDRISLDAFDIPWKLFGGFPLKRDKLFVFLGLGGSIYQNPPVGPGGGIVWLISKKLRLEGVFPKPALIFEPSEHWQIRAYGDLLHETFRTDDVETPIFELHNAVLEYSERRAGVQVSYFGLRGFTFIAAAGCTFERRFNFYRAEQSEEIDPAPFLRLSVFGKF